MDTDKKTESLARLKALRGFDSSEWTPEEMATLAWEAGKSIGWDDPSMAIYDEYEKHKNQVDWHAPIR